MTFTHEGREYKVMHQIGDTVQITKAFRMMPHNFIEVITALEYKELGETEVKKATIHIQDLLDLAAVVEQERMAMA